MQRIIPFLWFDDQAEEAVAFYTGIFNNVRTLETARYDKTSAETSGKPEGSVMTMEFELEDHHFIALNGGPIFNFTPAISFSVHCVTEGEVDELWAHLSPGGKVLMPLDKYFFSEKYGWIEDQYGVSWQINLSGGRGQKIVPSLLFVGYQAGKAEEAMNFYTSVFKQAQVGEIYRYGPGQAPNDENYINYAEFTLAGQYFTAMDSALDHQFTFTEAISLSVSCETQGEVDYYWNQLSAVPEAEQIGWLKDRFGVSWQIIPLRLNELLQDPDPEKAGKVMQAMMKMKKIDIAQLERTYNS